MWLETLIWHGYVHPARVEDDGLSARVDSLHGTSTMAFRTDAESVRAALGTKGSLCCDNLFVAVRASAAGGSEVSLILVELKGINLDHAVLQLETTLHALQAAIPFATESLERKRTRFALAVVTDRASPEQVRPSDQRRFGRLGVRLQVVPAQRRGASADLTELLRRMWQPGWRPPDAPP